MLHVRIGRHDNVITAVAFQPKSGGRVWDATSLTVYRTHGQSVLEFTTMALYKLKGWPERVGLDWATISGVWADPVLYAGYGLTGDKPPWELGKERDESTLFWLLGDPPIVDTGPKVKALDECVYRICQLQAVLGRLQK